MYAAYIRGVVLISGEREWAEQYGADLLAILDDNSLWIGDGAPADVNSDVAANAKRYLGQDFKTIVFNCYSGFHPDGFGALSGTIVGGGVLVLLTPSFDQWAAYQDPDYHRIAAHNTEVSSHNFIQRIIDKLSQNEKLWHIKQQAAVNSFPAINVPAFAPATKFTLTTDQQSAFEGIKKVAYGRPKRPLVITSDRGRGKSTVLGVAAADLLQEAVIRVALCAPSRSSVNAVFSHAHASLPDFTLNGNTLVGENRQLFFMPPDELLRLKPVADIVLVDEAAAIPASVLTAILLHYPRVVFATTVHGYEGNGRGFAVRFKPTLEDLCPQWRRVFLQQPMRWAEDDFLESLTADLLLLNASESVIAKSSTKSDLQLKFVSGIDLIANEKLLGELFGLLVQAHYRTSPDDLRLLLDGPNIKVALAVYDDAVVGAVLVSVEGNIERQLHQPIEQGSRRVSGHLVPQMLAAQAGMQNVLGLRCWRVMRIAVHPDLRRHAIGSKLLDAVVEKAKTKRQNYVATSFAASAEVVDFWLANGFTLQHIGWRRDSVSGAHTAVMAKPISDVTIDVLDQQNQRLRAQLPVLLAATLGDVEAEIAVKYIKNMPITDQFISAADGREIGLFVDHQRSFETSIAALSNTALMLIANLNDQKLCQLVVIKVLQYKSWQQTADLCGYSGKGDIVSDLKQAYSVLL
ncbi:MAG: tRNA(Met) cytidine acetyltransferase [Pseudomonadales bacterium]